MNKFLLLILVLSFNVMALPTFHWTEAVNTHNVFESGYLLECRQDNGAYQEIANIPDVTTTSFVLANGLLPDGQNECGLKTVGLDQVTNTQANSALSTTVIFALFNGELVLTRQAVPPTAISIIQ